MTSQIDLGKTIIDYCEQASFCSQTHPHKGSGVTRFFLSDEHRQVIDLVKSWMIDAGMQTHLDHAGSLIGTLYSDDEQAKTLILGSHVDTVRQGGKYDGMLGVILPIVCLKAMHQQQIKLPFHVKVAAFGDEEGSRFLDSMVGSSALAGQFKPSALNRLDDSGISMKKAMLDFGLEPDKISECQLNPDDLLGFVEVHIEQGPVLENNHQPLGIVTSICGLERHIVEMTGETGHAGTVPMDKRQDALVAASHAMVAIDHYLQANAELVGVVGELAISPGSVNAIPGKVKFTLEFRSPKKTIRDKARIDLTSCINTIATQKNVTVSIEQTERSDSVDCNLQLSTQLSDAVKRCGHNPLQLFSGAGHDAQIMAAITPIAMLFMRCYKGLSHHPDESILIEDAQAGALVLIDFLTHFEDSIV